ncbi:uncharacterized protein DEA37_0003747, partial [Paragonimus westermani]
LSLAKQIDTEHFHFMDSFLRGLSASLYVIIISELGDKTFFIAAIMAMQHPRCLVYAGAMGALATMTILSGISCLGLISIHTHIAILGYATTVVPRTFTFYCSGVLFLVFGLKMLYDAYTMSPTDAQEEYEEVKSQLAQSSIDVETGKVDPQSSRFYLRGRLRDAIKRILSPVLAEAFVLTFLAEWGDRSQLTTIVLAATKSVSGVIVGGVLGHAVCTGLAVLMGRFIAQRIPVKWLTYIGGVTFLLFALSTFLGNPDSNS